MNFRIYDLVIATTLLLTVIFTAGCSDSDDRVNDLLDQGIKYFDNQEFSKAQKVFNQSLKLDNKVAESYFYLGEISWVQGDTAAAVDFYKQAIALKESYTNARINLGRLYVNVQRLNDAQMQVDVIMLSDATNSGARALQALIMLKQGKEQDAEALLKNILEFEPGNVLATEMLARNYLLKGKEDKALQVLERANEANAGTKNSILKPLLALYTNRKLTSEAEQVLLQLVKNNQNNLQYYRGLIEFYARLDRINDAVLVLRDSITKDPDNDARYQLLIDLYKDRYGLRKAISETRQLINDKPEMSSLRLALAQLYAADEQPSKSEVVLQGVVEMEGPKDNGLAAKVEIAKLSLRQNDLTKANQLISEVLAVNPKQENALLLRSGIALQQKDFIQASFLLDQVIQVNPNNKQARMRKAALLESQGELEASLMHIDAILSKNGNLIPVLKLKAKILSRQRKYDELALVFTELETISPESADGFLANGKLFLRQKKNREALAKFKKAYSLDLNSIESLRGLVTAQIRLGDTGDTVKLLEKIIKETPQHPAATELLGNVYLSRKEYSQAEKMFLRQLDSGVISKSIYVRLAQSRMQQGNEKGAIDTLIKGINKRPRNLRLRIKLAQTYELSGELHKAEEILEEAASLAPRNTKLKTMLNSVRNKQRQ